MNWCKECFNSNKNEECPSCTRNPINIHLKDHFMGHPITCPYGYTNCVNDPGYIWLYYHDWFVSLYGDCHYSQCSCPQCEDGSDYDDEDK